KWDVLPHPPYSPDIAPSDYWSFRRMQHDLAGHRQNNGPRWLDGYFEELDDSHCKQDIEAIEHRWEKCIELKGDYVEK
ncbi:Histone-lysine N-methyltransferase SETMAR, partial [Harpegnathos saltator]